MEFLAHRGLWFEKNERNDLAALFRGLVDGYGLETDIRDLDGQLVISHDIPLKDTVVSVEELFSFYTKSSFSSTLALNIKSDGLQSKLYTMLMQYNIENYFVFDMSIPDTLSYLKSGMKTFARRSDIENSPELYLRSQGIWLDELVDEWVTADVIVTEAKNVSKLCIVSGELHGRDYKQQWKQIKKALDLGCPSDKLLLCTDVPHIAKEFFN
ncbi:MAG: hypothetical protein V4732_08895 [Pseudomonadota bacterium]